MLGDSMLKCKHAPACLSRAHGQPGIQQMSFNPTSRARRASSIIPFKPHRKQGKIMKEASMFSHANR